jgi:5-formyltetrahydrofolate cyclo-ligase
VRPTVLLVPLVGFDAQGYRLGYGGGYYDRTLAAMTPRARAIGVGYELGRLETIHPQPHDVPMDAIVTEAGVFETPARRDAEPRVRAGPGRGLRHYPQ